MEKQRLSYRKYLFLIMSIIICLFWIIKVIGNWKYYDSADDVFWHTLFLFEDATIFSVGYSEEFFERVQPQMRQSEVVNLLGEPFLKETYKNKQYSELWRYSKAPDNANYWMRLILFTEGGDVLRKTRKYTVD